MLEKLLDAIKARFPLTENEGSTRQFQVMGMTFEARAYAARGLGHVGVMTAQGPMQMETLVINPFERDAPILSYDRIHGMGQETVIAEMYDSLLGDSFCADGIVQTLGESAAILEKEQEDWYAPLIVRPWLHRKGNTEEAEQKLKALDGIISSLFEEGNPVGVKTALYLKGVCTNTMRLPLVPGSEALQAKLKSQIAKYEK